MYVICIYRLTAGLSLIGVDHELPAVRVLAANIGTESNSRVWSASEVVELLHTALHSNQSIAVVANAKSSIADLADRVLLASMQAIMLTYATILRYFEKGGVIY